METAPRECHQVRQHFLVPYDPGEALTVREASKLINRSEATTREWVALHGLGRRVGGPWLVSKVALAMHLDGDRDALRLYHAGDRSSRSVLRYFERYALTAQPIERADA